jgi:hypothetical protein
MDDHQEKGKKGENYEALERKETKIEVQFVRMCYKVEGRLI